MLRLMKSRTLTFTDLGKRAVESYTRKVKETSQPYLNKLVPVAARLAKTNRHEVERLKLETERLEEGFKQSRQTLVEATKSLEGIKTELYELYLRREFEYRKSKSDVQVIREINEMENNLKEKEERQQQIVDNLTKEEQELFDKTRSSYQSLYNSTRDYATRYIVLGIAVATIMTTWKGFQYVSTLRHSTPPPNDIPPTTNTSFATSEIINCIKEHSESITSKFLEDMRSENATLKHEIIDAIKKSSIDVAIEKDSAQPVVSNDTAVIVALSLAAGIVGGSLSLLLFRN